jgi:hypothetical protein
MLVPVVDAIAYSERISRLSRLPPKCSGKILKPNSSGLYLRNLPAAKRDRWDEGFFSKMGFRFAASDKR